MSPAKSRFRLMYAVLFMKCVYSGSAANCKKVESNPAPTVMFEPRAKYRAKADLLEGPDFGFSFLPYVEFDAGGHANRETVTNTKAKASLEVPRHGIFRVYAGGVVKFEYKRARSKLDSAMIEMATEEKIGVVTTTGVSLRRVTGIQPHSLASLDFGMDPARHYVRSFSYENGRAAPNLEYLSKFASGIKVIY